MNTMIFSDILDMIPGEYRLENGIEIDSQGRGAVEIVIPIKNLSGGEAFDVYLLSKSSMDAFCKCYVGARFYAFGKPVKNETLKKKKLDMPNEYCGHYQVYRDVYHESVFRFLMPFCANECELVLTAADDARFSIKDMRIEPARKTAALPGGIKFVSHLGMTGYAPKNSMHGFRMSCAAGYRECVTNTNYTKDGSLVALHDNTIDATSNGTGAIREMTLAEARQYDFGAYVSEVYKGTQLPLLSDVLSLMAKSGVRPVLRLGDFRGEGEKYLKDLLELSRKTGHEGNLTAKAFSMEVLENFSRLANDQARYGLCTDLVTEEKARWLKGLGKDVYFDVRYSSLTDEMLNIAFDYEIPVESWIVNEFDTIVKLSRKGVSGFTTDFFPADGFCFA